KGERAQDGNGDGRGAELPPRWMRGQRVGDGEPPRQGTTVLYRQGAAGSNKLSRRTFVLYVCSRRAQGESGLPGRPSRADPRGGAALLRPQGVPPDVHAGPVRRGRAVLR